MGGLLHVGTRHEIAEQTGVFTRHGIDRIVRYAFEVAAKRPRQQLASATKSNALRYGMVLWDEVAEEVSADYPSVSYRKYYVDAIYLGAIGAPSVPDHISAGDMILPLRKRFDQYVNLRPMRLLPGLASPLVDRGAADIDMVCVREN